MDEMNDDSWFQQVKTIIKNNVNDNMDQEACVNGLCRGFPMVQSRK